MDPFSVLNPGARSDILLLGDHAGRAIPDDLNGLGLAAAALASHIAWDIGVAELGFELAGRLGATFISQRYSRLFIDCNRDPATVGSIAETSDGVAVPGNQGLTRDARTARRRAVFDPYHDRIDAELDARSGRPTVVVSLHSFTPRLAGGQPRPWRFGVLHLPPSQASERMLTALRRRLDPGLVGDNQPYRMDGTDYTVPRHAIARGLDYLELEVRQDTILTASDRSTVIDLLAPTILEATRSR
jgi:predicted N-formylglutamate amidohydrolase